MNLSSKLSELKHKGYITSEEYDRLKQCLNSLKVIEDIKADIKKHCTSHWFMGELFSEEILEIIDNHLEPYKEKER